MVEHYTLPASIDTPELAMSLDRRMQVASLRYFDVQGAFSRAIEASMGVPLPAPLRATSASPQTAAEAVLAWRSPTETLLLCSEPGFIAALGAQTASMTDGCLVDQSGGALVFRLRGKRIRDLFQRIAGQGTLPALGEARSSRLADVPVLVMQVRSDEILLMVDRQYAEHMVGWIGASAEDLN
jgi:heterotetrameric sarcosine oxidase gamma subunit